MPPMPDDDQEDQPIVAPPKLPPPHPPIRPTATQPSSSPQPPQQTNTASIDAVTAGQIFGNIMAQQARHLHVEEHWMKSYWRPAAAWLYMLICLMDFVIFPALTMVLPAFLKDLGVPISYSPWNPLTLQSGGMIHLAFGAILGVAAWTRGNEKIARAKS